MSKKAPINVQAALDAFDKALGISPEPIDPLEPLPRRMNDSDMVDAMREVVRRQYANVTINREAMEAARRGFNAQNPLLERIRAEQENRRSIRNSTFTASVDDRAAQTARLDVESLNALRACFNRSFLDGDWNS